jgi:hypothetical protein
MVFSFSVDKSIMPRGFDIDNDSKPKNEIPDSSKTKIGKVYLNYSNYIVNKGIPDEVFIKQDEKQ